MDSGVVGRISRIGRPDLGATGCTQPVTRPTFAAHGLSTTRGTYWGSPALLILLANSLQAGKPVCCNSLHYTADALLEAAPCHFNSDLPRPSPRIPPASPAPPSLTEAP